LGKKNLKDYLKKKESEEEVRVELEELLRGVRETTKRGGYEEVPRDLILEQARRIGLSEEDIPEVKVEETRGGYIDVTPEGKPIIVIPRREPKWKVPDTLRHELAHYKLGLPDRSMVEGTWEEKIKNELGAMAIQRGGRLDSNALVSLILTLVLEEGLPKRKATAWVMEEARDMGVSEHSITSAKRQLRAHWRGLKELEEYL